jgi:hypothetical protein
MPIQIRGELLLAAHASASIWEGRFHFCGDPNIVLEERVKVLRPLSSCNQHSAFSQETQPRRTQSTQKEIEIWNCLATLRPSRSLQ